MWPFFGVLLLCLSASAQDNNRDQKQLNGPKGYLQSESAVPQQQDYPTNYYQPHANYGNPRKNAVPQNNAQKFRPNLVKQNQKDEEPLTSSEERELQEYEEEQKPDRLTELLKTSTFNCQGKKDGYYADDGLNCEVFHYCQDGGKHSWLCPNQFAFHQIHLICVPPSSDNICKQSTDFHFVNDYLYKPVNQKEATAYNTSLKYADRFFPDGYQSGGAELMPYDDDRRPQQQNSNQNQRPFDDDDEGNFRPQQVNNRGRFPPQQAYRPTHPGQFGPPPGPSPNQYIIPRQNNPNQQIRSSPTQQKPNYFTNPEAINIPLTHRRPIPSQNTNFRPSPQINVKSKDYY